MGLHSYTVVDVYIELAAQVWWSALESLVASKKLPEDYTLEAKERAAEMLRIRSGLSIVSCRGFIEAAEWAVKNNYRVCFPEKK